MAAQALLANARQVGLGMTVDGVSYSNCQQNNTTPATLTCTKGPPDTLQLKCQSFNNVLRCGDEFTGSILVEPDQTTFQQQTGQKWPPAPGMGMNINTGVQLACNPPTGTGPVICQTGPAQGIAWPCTQTGSTVKCDLPVDYTYQITGNSINVGSYEPAAKSYAQMPAAQSDDSTIWIAIAIVVLIVIIVIVVLYQRKTHSAIQRTG